MRVRISTCPPLPALKAWVPAPEHGKIIDLKKSLQTIVDASLTADDIALELDGFELLDQSSIDVLRDGELVEIKQKARKRTASNAALPAPRPLKRQKTDSSSSDEDSSTSEASSSSSSSYWSSSSQSATPDTSVLSKLNFVPPGQGKTATHSRNRRRRIRRAALAVAAATSVPDSVPFSLSESNATGIPSNITSSDVFMGSLARKNKNKSKKGYRQPPAVLPPKIVFEGAEITVGETSVVQPQRRGPRLIPPSEKQELGLLPPRMFVTSIDVEAGLWHNKSRKRKEEEWIDEPVETLDYGEAPSSTSPQLPTNLETQYDDGKLTTVTDAELLKVGGIVVWKALALNLETFSPEIKLHIATVVAVEADSIRYALVKATTAEEEVDEDEDNTGEILVNDLTSGIYCVVPVIEAKMDTT